MEEDKKTIGLTEFGRGVIQSLIDRGWFNDQMDVARLAVAIAIKHGNKPDQLENAGTVWNVGSFDPDGEFKKIIPILFPDVSTPYRATEYLINAGLIHISNMMDDPSFDISFLI